MSCCILSQKILVSLLLSSCAMKNRDWGYKLWNLICMVHIASGLDGCEALWWSPTGRC